MKAPVVVFGIGNRSRGDDAAGPLVVERLAARLAREGKAGRAECLEEYQLAPEHALDLVHRECAIFVDARADLERGCSVEAVAPVETAFSASTHELSPGEMLAVYRQVTGEAPPPAWLVGVAAKSFELGERPREETCGAMDEAEAVLARLVLGGSA